MTEDAYEGKVLGGRYQIQSRIGRGGMATVYKAYDSNLRRFVAIKIIHPHLSEDADFLRRFKDEATVVAQLSHANIAVVYDFVQEGNLCYIVMEYVDGETLETQLKHLSETSQRLPVKDAIQYVIDLCAAANYAHQHGVIHRDIKPANIMIEAGNKVFLMDFGIAKIVGGQQHTATGKMLGTALYMAPEQIQGLMVDARADIYSLGVTLFEMLNGKPPYEADSAMTLMMMHLNDPIPDIHELHPDVPEDMVAIIDKAMAKNRNERFQSATEMAAALRQVLAGKPLPVKSPYQQPAPLNATIIEGAAAIQSMPAPVKPAESPVIPSVGKAGVSFPQTPEETEYPVQPKRSKAWLFILAIILLAVLGGGAYFLFGSNSSQGSPSDNPPINPPSTASPVILNTSPVLLPTSTIEPIDTPEPTVAYEPTDTTGPILESTPTSQPTDTEIPVENNSGFVNNCIDTNVWSPYKLQGISQAPDGCWDLSHWGISAENGHLLIYMDKMLNDSERSIYRKLPPNATIKLKVRVDELLTLTNLSGGFALGIGRPENWQDTGKYIIFRRNATQPSMQIYLSNGVKSEGIFYQDAELNNEYDVEIRFENGEVSFYLDGAETHPPFSLPANILANPVFSIGYGLPTDGSINATIVELIVEEK
jgi:serine/threonine protein kinase